MGKRTWTEDEIKILYDYFPEYGIYKCVELIPGHSREAIKGKIDALHIYSNHRKKWTDEENEKIKEAWRSYSMQDLLNCFPGRTYQQIELHAHLLGCHTDTYRLRKNNLSFMDLNNLNKENSYWWGFVMADGCIRRNGQIIIQIRDIDRDHLEKFCKHVNSNINVLGRFVRTACGYKDKVNEWMDVLKMERNIKTYYPPDLKIFQDTFIYFFIGFVDGDGCIWMSRGYPQLKIELYSSWKNNLDWFAEVLKNEYDISSVTTKISKKGTSVLTIGNRQDIIKISKYCDGIDYLSRKWNKIFELCK